MLMPAIQKENIGGIIFTVDFVGRQGVNSPPAPLFLQREGVKG
jgi:hypothetical protein